MTLEVCYSVVFFNALAPMVSVLTTVAAQVMSKSHTFKSASLRLQYVYRVKQKEDFIMNQLAVRNLPDGVEKEVYEVTIAGCLDMEEEEDFHLQLFDDSSAIITFAKSYAMEGNHAFNHNSVV